MSAIERYGFASTHWALGGLVLIALAASEYSGAGTLVALPITAIGVTFGALSGCRQTERSLSKRKHCSDLIYFLEIWLDILEHLVASATCARVASATVDYMSEGRLREWLFGIESHSLGEPWPDVLGISIIAVTTMLFMFGLEKSKSFCLLLYLGIALSFVFFTSIGGYHTDIIFWNWKEDFQKRSWGCMLTTAAMCAFGFVNSFQSALLSKRLKLTALVIFPLFCYSVIATVFTLMSHYREVAGNAIPLVRVFEVRDVDWARPIMAACTICVVCLALTEIMPSLHNLLVKLAGRDWKVLVSPILYRNSLTGAPVLAIFTAGSLTSILAFACPLSYLVRLVNISSLYKCTLKSCTALYDRYKSTNNEEGISVMTSDVQYCKLNNATKLKTARKSRSLYDMLPNYLKKNRKVAVATTDATRSTRSRKSSSGDKEYLLLDQYTSSSLDHFTADTLSDSDVNVSVNGSDAEEDSSSSTDIDAVVQEYKDRIQVSTIGSFNNRRSPTALTSRLVAIFILLLCVMSSVLSISICWNLVILGTVSIIIAVLSLFGICIMPQNTSTEYIITSPVLMPWICFISIIVNVLLATTLLIEIWPAILLWLLAGLLLYSRCNCCGCVEEDNRLLHGKTECSISDSTSSRQEKFIEVDTILIPR